MHLGTRYLGHANDPGLPSHQVAVFWSLAWSALFTRRFAPWGFPLLSVGLPVGCPRATALQSASGVARESRLTHRANAQP